MRQSRRFWPALLAKCNLVSLLFYHSEDGDSVFVVLAPGEIQTLFDALISGLEDYSVDERGDVGSWVRITCVQGLSEFATVMFRNADHIANFAEYFPPEKYHAAVSGILKQGIERLDNVRQQAGEQVVILLNGPLPSVPNAEAWRIHGESLLKLLFIGFVAFRMFISVRLAYLYP